MGNTKRTGHDMPVFKSDTEATKAYLAFLEDVESAREKHGIHDVFVLACPLQRDEVDGKPVDIQTAGSITLGSQTSILPLLASVYGKMRREFQKRMDAAAYGEPSK